MRTMIVPCAGKKIINKLPIFLNRHPDGELIAIKTIQGVYPEKYDRIIYVVSKEIEEKYNAEFVLNRENRNRHPIEVCILNNATSGPAMTVCEAIKRAEIVDEFVVRDSHAFLEIREDYQGNFIAGLDLTKYNKVIDNLRDKSFLILNEQNNVLDVVEKHFCSDVISAGLYGFKSTDDFLMAYEHLDDPNYSITKKYVSHIISYLIGYKKRVFHAFEVSEYEDWSTDASWAILQKHYANCFLNLDKICDDGNFFTNETLLYLQKLSNSGVAFIGLTYKNELPNINSHLRENGVRIIDTVYGCNYSRLNMVANSVDDIRNMALEV